jgi:hypothetical protein
MLHAFACPSAANWDKLLPQAGVSVNNAVDYSTASSPFVWNMADTWHTVQIATQYRHAATALQQSVDQVRDSYGATCLRKVAGKLVLEIRLWLCACIYMHVGQQHQLWAGCWLAVCSVAFLRYALFNSMV